MNNGWIGVDLDGTLAEYHGWVSESHIGKPVAKMVERVKAWIEEGREVKIFTARVYRRTELVNRTIEDWCKEHIGKVLPITCTKDYSMIELWDDRCVQVIPNTGISVQEFIDYAEKEIKEKLNEVS